MHRWSYKSLAIPPTTSLHDVPLVNALLHQRNLDTPDAVSAYFTPSIDRLHSPWALYGMEKAAERLRVAVQNGERIFLYGDYDVDGITAAALVWNVLKHYAVAGSLGYALAHRQGSGYGLSTEAVQQALTHGASVLVVLDCGTKDFEATQLATDHGIDVLICDHHTPGGHLPVCHSLINPQQAACDYPNTGLSGCALGFKLMQATEALLSGQDVAVRQHAWTYLDVVAVSLLADVVPLVGENRVLVQLGLRKLLTQPILGFAALCEVARITPTGVEDVTFGIAPHLNAAGRIGSPEDALALLIEEDQRRAVGIAQQLCALNAQRKVWQASATQEASKQLAAKADRHVFVGHGEGWHIGVVGIVAARCVEMSHKPCVIFTTQKGLMIGSARSIPSVDIHAALRSCGHLLSRFGGHAQAAGCTLVPTQLAAFEEALNEAVGQQVVHAPDRPDYVIDMPFPISSITHALLEALEQLAPFGAGNPRPIFADAHVQIRRAQAVGKDRTHLHLQVVKQGSTMTPIKAMGWHMGHWAKMLTQYRSTPIHIAYTLEVDRGGQGFYLGLQDIIFD